MRIILPALLVFSFSTSILAQEKGISSQEFSTESKSESINRIYASAAYSESADIFGEIPDLFKVTFSSMIQDLDKYLDSAGFVWNEEVTYTFFVYIGQNGTIDHLVYKFHNNGATFNEDHFHELLNEWINYYRFPLRASGSFRHNFTSKFKPSPQ